MNLWSSRHSKSVVAETIVFALFFTETNFMNNSEQQQTKQTKFTPYLFIFN